ncbi:hypothetical protein HW555_002673 [Spodoptera exigua]|uniref:Uncharacterized protein n=1 Tax=Spodoptera exigua TaxID=7107 RepID=A0A835GN04_SPOEX|nr:hypothetical protein HW555_002673 [Spodoptera exigua]
MSRALLLLNKMDSELYTNITHRKPFRASSLEDLSNLENMDNEEKTIFDSTMMSIPDSLHDNSNIIIELSEQVKALKMQLKDAHLEIENLNSENFRLKSDLQNMTIKTDKETQTCDTNNIQTTNSLKTAQNISPSFKNNLPKHTGNLTSTIVKHQQKNKLCILSSHKSRGALSIIEDVFSKYFDFCHYVFPNGTVKELLYGIENKLRNFTLNDYCIILIGENDIKENKNYITTINMIKEAFQKVTHTNNIICCPTYVRGAPIHNFRVEMFNNLINLSIQDNEYAYLFDSNYGLSLDMFSYITGKINNQGIRNIYERIMENILIDINTFNKFDIDTNIIPDETTNSPQNETDTQFFL